MDKSISSLQKLLIAICVIGLLVMIVVPQITSAGQRAKERDLKQNLADIRDAITLFETDLGDYPVKLDQLVAKKAPKGLGGRSLVLAKDDFSGPYLKSILVDPFTGKAPTTDKPIWTYNCETGNVHFSSTKVGLNGKRYCDW